MFIIHFHCIVHHCCLIKHIMHKLNTEFKFRITKCKPFHIYAPFTGIEFFKMLVRALGTYKSCHILPGCSGQKFPIKAHHKNKSSLRNSSTNRKGNMEIQKSMKKLQHNISNILIIITRKHGCKLCTNLL